MTSILMVDVRQRVRLKPGICVALVELVGLPNLNRGLGAIRGRYVEAFDR